MLNEKTFIATFSQVTAPEQLRTEIMNFQKSKKKHISKVAYFAAVISIVFFLLACANALEAGAMMEALFGKNGRESIEAERYVLQYENGRNQEVTVGSGNRTQLNTALAKDYIIPHVFEINRTIYDGDTAITVEYGIVDRACSIGAIYVKIDNPPLYRVTNRGQILWMNENNEYSPYLRSYPIGQEGFVGNEMIVEALTTDKTLYMTYLFTCESDCTGMVMQAGKMQLAQDIIQVDFPVKSEMTSLSLAEGRITLSPFGAKLDSEFFGMNFMTLDCVSIFYKNGEEYILQWEDKVGQHPSVYNVNYTCFLDDENTEVVYFFNRVLDLNEVESVAVNGQQFNIE